MRVCLRGLCKKLLNYYIAHVGAPCLDDVAPLLTPGQKLYYHCMKLGLGRPGKNPLSASQLRPPLPPGNEKHSVRWVFSAAGASGQLLEKNHLLFHHNRTICALSPKT